MGAATVGMLTEDITERVLSREALERSNEDLEQFAYIASHDLQEPLRAISNFTDLLTRRYKGQLDEKANTYLGFLSSESARLQKLILGILDWSRVTSMGNTPTATDSSQTVRAVVAALKNTGQHSDADIQWSDLPVVRVDPSQLHQLFLNLLSNAVKFRGEAPPKVHISAESVNGLWRFSVTDNGIGIPEALAADVFNLFRQLHPRDTYPGTGIGLALCKRIVERHGGTIDVVAAPGGGSTFRFTLPAG